MIAVHIRPMISADLEAVLKIAASLPDAPHWPRESYLRAIQSGGTPCRLALVAELPDASVAGFTVVSLLPPEAELETIAVASARQRQGIAGALMAYLLRELAARQVDSVHLEVRASNIAAQGLYRKWGFRNAARRRGYYTNPPEDAVLMTYVA